MVESGRAARPRVCGRFWSLASNARDTHQAGEKISFVSQRRLFQQISAQSGRLPPEVRFTGLTATQIYPKALRSRVKNAAPRPGHERNVLSLPRGDLPVGRFVDRAVQPSLQKYFASVVGRNIFMSLAIPSHTEGRFAIVTDVGAGCGGRGSVWRAMGSQGGSKDL